MIDIIKVEEEFKKYVEPYDITNPKIERKVVHTFRTANVAKEIAESLELEEEDILLAQLIGILHDIGRFEQVRIYNTYNDIKSIDHADFGVEILFKEEKIKDFIEDRQYDDIIYKSIKNHNKYATEKGLNDRELLHSKIIKDADKTDIFAVHVGDIQKRINDIYKYDDVAKQKITPIVLKTFLKHELTDKRNVKNDIDSLINIISFIYDFNFKKGLEMIKENKYIEKLIFELEKTNINIEQTLLIKNTALDFLENRLKSF